LEIYGQDLIDKKTKGIIVPLKAIIDGETIIGPDLSKEEWTTLKSRHKKGLTITMGCCGAPGHRADICSPVRLGSTKYPALAQTSPKIISNP
jgi:hypothetical protein